MILTAAEQKKRKQDEILAEQRRLEEEERRKEREEIYHNEVARFIALENAALDWHRSQIINRYIEALERYFEENPGDPDQQAEIKGWISWAKAKTKWLDPISAKVDPILGFRDRTVMAEDYRNNDYHHDYRINDYFARKQGVFSWWKLS